MVDYNLIGIKNMEELDFERFINNKYSDINIDLENSIWKQMESSVNLDDNVMCLEYTNIEIGRGFIFKIIPKYFIYKHMINNLLSEKGNNIRDCEFVINVCDNPIVNYLGGKLLSPDIFNVNINDTHLELLPILSSNIDSNYSDITIPDYLSYSAANNLYYPTITNNNKYKCVQNRFDDTKGSIDNNLLSLLINYSGVSNNPRRNLRLKVINSLTQIKESLLKEGCTLEAHLVSSGLKTVFPNIIEEDGQLEYLEDKNLGNFTELKYDYQIDGSGKIPKALLYVDGVGTDFILTKMLSMGIPIIQTKR